GARGPRRQPHRPHVHGRSERRLALRRALPRGLRQPADLAPSRRRAPAPRRLHHGDDPLRPTGEQADAERGRRLRALLPQGAAAAGPRARGRRPRADRLAGLSTSAAPARRFTARADACVRARRADDVRRRRHADRLVPPEPAEHLHGQAHAPDAPRRVQEGPPAPRRGGPGREPSSTTLALHDGRSIHRLEGEPMPRSYGSRKAPAPALPVEGDAGRYSTRSEGRRGRSATVSESSRLWPSRTIVTRTRCPGLSVRTRAA